MLPGGQRPQRDDSEQHNGTPSTTVEGEGIMATSGFALTGRFLAGIAAASLLAGVSVDSQAAPGSKGIIELKLSSSSNASNDNLFTWDDPTDGLGPVLKQKFNLPKNLKCIVAEHEWIDQNGDKGEPTLVKVTAIGPTGTRDPRVGLQYGSLGVYDNSNGTSCTRMTASIGEGLLFQPLVGGFDKLELDMELKGNAVFRLQINPHPSGDVTKGGHQYFLRSGTSQALEPAANVTNCTGSSDSGPDSGPNDNCPWIIEDVGSSFDLRAVETGEGSLEGGGDGLPALSSKIFLTSLIDVGTLSCDGSAPPKTDNMTALVYSPTDDAARCMVTRIGTPGGACDYLLKYKLETFSFDSLCSLDKFEWVNKLTGAVLPATSFPVVSAEHKQTAGANQVTFLVEDRTVWDIEQTYMTFTMLPTATDPAPQTPPYYLSRCGGTVVQVGPDGSVVETGGETTIKEVLEGSPSNPNDGLEGYIDAKGRFVAGPPDGGYSSGQMVHLWDGVCVSGGCTSGNDAVPNNGLIDWACVLDNTETYVGDDEMYVTQHILFWGDAYFGRN
jgi:hypothetical protein